MRIFESIPAINRKLNIAQVIRYLDSANRLMAQRPELAAQIALACYRQSNAMYFHHGAAVSLYTMALLQEKRSNFDSALVLYKSAIPLTLRSNKNQVQVIYIQMANVYLSTGQYEQALECNYRAIDALSRYNLKLSNRDSVALFHNIALTWQTLGETAKAAGYLALVKRAAFSSRSPASLLLYYRILLHLSPGLSDSVKGVYHQKMLELGHEAKDLDAQAVTLNNLCIFYIDRHLPDSARIYLDRMTTLFNNNRGLCDFNFFLAAINEGRILQLEGKYAEAEQVLLGVYAKLTALQFRNMQIYIEPYLAALYRVRGKYGKAYVHMKYFVALQDSMLSRQRIRSVDNWMKSRIVAQDKQLLEKQLLISTKHKALQQKNFWMISIISLGILLCFLLISFLRRSRNKQRLHQEALAQLRRMQQIDFLKAQVRGEEQERNRVATDLHDSIASQIWVIKLNLDDVLKGTETHAERKKNLEAIYDHLDGVAQEIRETAHNLMPTLLLEQGLSKAIVALCDRVKKNSSLDVEFQEYGLLPTLAPELELSIYRMIEELAQNVLKHAQATLLLVQLSYVNTLLNVTIEDNGCGLATMESRNKFGLKNIQRRVELLQGQFDFKSKPGMGTTIYIEFDVRCFPAVYLVE